MAVYLQCEVISHPIFPWIIFELLVCTSNLWWKWPWRWVIMNWQQDFFYCISVTN